MIHSGRKGGSARDNYPHYIREKVYAGGLRKKSAKLSRFILFSLVSSESQVRCLFVDEIGNLHPTISERVEHTVRV